MVDPRSILDADEIDGRRQANSGASASPEGGAQVTSERADQLVASIRERFVGEVEAEPDADNRNRYQFWVFSPQFKGMTHLQRQDALWKLVEQLLSREEQLDVTM